jgi:hypothetical protein
MWPLSKGSLSSEERDALPDSDFVFPDKDKSKRRYPINDEAHARDALARVTANGTAEEKAKVRAAVQKRYPAIKMSKTEIVAPLLKTEREGIFMLPLIVPGREDAHGHIFSKEETAQIAHQAIRVYAGEPAERGPNIGHGGRNADAPLIESFLMPADVTVDGQLVPEGTFVQTFKVEDPLLKQEIENQEIDAGSWEGEGFLDEIAA